MSNNFLDRDILKENPSLLALAGIMVFIFGILIWNISTYENRIIEIKREVMSKRLHFSSGGTLMCLDNGKGITLKWSASNKQCSFKNRLELICGAQIININKCRIEK